MDLDLIIRQVVSLSGYLSQLHEDLSIYEVGFTPTCIKGLERVGVQTLRDIFDIREHSRRMTVDLRYKSAQAYIEAVKYLHMLGWWPWPEDLKWFDNNG
jgi:hypothetical protein